MSSRVFWAAALVAVPIATLPLSGQERGRGGPVNLPNGPGKEIVRAKCESCSNRHPCPRESRRR
jgi:hypothetical protein